jgi:hypothetical protein
LQETLRKILIELPANFKSNSWTISENVKTTGLVIHEIAMIKSWAFVILLVKLLVTNQNNGSSNSYLSKFRRGLKDLIDVGLHSRK